MDIDKLEQIQNFAIERHEAVGQMYGDLPYDVHLMAAIMVAESFIYLIPKQDKNSILAAIWLHDTIEDCGVTYNKIKEIANIGVANIVYAVTNPKGKNRVERNSHEYYTGIREQKYATFVKLCDRIANVTLGKKKNNMYRIENLKFIANLVNLDYIEMFQYLKNILK